MELTSKQAAERLGVSPSRVRQLVLAGEIKSRLLTPRLMLIDEREVAKFKRPKMGRPPKKAKGKGAK